MKNTYLIWFSALAVSVACCTNAFGYIGPEALESGVPECIGKSLNTFRCARGIERKVLDRQKTGVKRSDGTLIIKTKKKVLRLVDNLSESGNESIAYSYLGYVNSINSHVLHVQYYEGGAYMVINAYSGNRAYPSGYPIISPDRRHFLSVSEDMFAGYDPNNVEIWRVASEGFKRLANFEPDWGPRSGQWVSSANAKIEKFCHIPSEENAAELRHCGIARVKQTSSGWKLVE